MNLSKFKHLMLDIETMGSNSYSSILSIGALEFDIETGETGNEFHVNVDLQSCIDAGLIVNASTIIWWMQQSEESRSRFAKKNAVSIKHALLSFSGFCHKEYQVWGNSARFDCGILQNAYNKLSEPIPWDFRKERCVRTLVSFNPKAKEGYQRKGIEHDALDDCYTQVGYCHEIWRSLSK